MEKVVEISIITIFGATAPSTTRCEQTAGINNYCTHPVFFIFSNKSNDNNNNNKGNASTAATVCRFSLVLLVHWCSVLLPEAILMCTPNFGILVAGNGKNVGYQLSTPR